MPGITNRKWVYLPMETLARELPSRVLLALELARRGYAVVLGPRPLAHLAGSTLPPGMILFKSLANMGDQFAARRSRHNTITAICEEGLVYPSGEAYVYRRIDPDAWREVSRFYAWGESQAGDIREFMGDDRSIIRVTGNPRFDVLKRWMKRPGSHRTGRPYILISSTFGSVNPLAQNERVRMLRETASNAMRSGGIQQSPN